MKRVCSWILLAVLMLNVIPFAAKAAQTEQETIHFTDGSYVIVEIFESVARASGSKTAKKQYTYYDDNDDSQWKAVLTGSFTYTGSSSSCTTSSVDVTIYNSAWSVSFKTASKSGNTAKASVTMARSYDGDLIKVPVNLTLTCDANGNLS